MPVAMILFPSFYHFTIPFYSEIFLLSFFFVFSDLISVERRRSEAVFGLCSLCGEKGGSRLSRLVERGGAQSVTVKWKSIAVREDINENIARIANAVQVTI